MRIPVPARHFLPSPRRDPRIKSGEGSRATSRLLQSWIPAFAGMTKERRIPRCYITAFAIASKAASNRKSVGSSTGCGWEESLAMTSSAAGST